MVYMVRPMDVSAWLREVPRVQQGSSSSVLELLRGQKCGQKGVVKEDLRREPAAEQASRM